MARIFMAESNVTKINSNEKYNTLTVTFLGFE